MKKIRVLITDDVDQVRKDLRTLFLLVADIQVIGEAMNGMEAVEKARSLNPDVVLMDLEMPIMDGFEATRQIKTQPMAPRVIILSIHAGSKEQEHARSAGADGFFVKGVRLESLVNAILGREDRQFHPK
jgi:DNA-binding NarL/FixJ family response regulator